MPVVRKEKIHRIAKSVAEVKFRKKFNAAQAKLKSAVESQIRRDQKHITIPGELVDEQFIKMRTRAGVRTKGDTGYRYEVTIDPTPCMWVDHRIYVNETPQIAKAYRLLKEVEEERQDYEIKLRRALTAFKTDKCIIENIPEMSKYLARENITPPLPSGAIIPVSMIQEFRKDIKNMQKVEASCQ